MRVCESLLYLALCVHTLGVFMCAVFPFALRWWDTITVIDTSYRQPDKHTRTLRLTYHQWHSVNGAWAKWNSLLYSKDTLSNKWLCQESDAMLLINLALKFHFKKKSEKQTGNDKYKRNPSHKICLEASIWTGCGQQHQSQEPLPLSSHLCELKHAFLKSGF